MLRLPSFDLLEPNSLREALDQLAEHDQAARVRAWDALSSAEGGGAANLGSVWHIELDESLEAVFHGVLAGRYRVYASGGSMAIEVSCGVVSFESNS